MFDKITLTIAGGAFLAMIGWAIIAPAFAYIMTKPLKKDDKHDKDDLN